MRSEQKIKDGLLSDLYKEYKQITSKHEEIKLRIFIGEVDDQEDQGKVAHLEHLVHDGAIISFEIQTDSVDTDDGNFFLAFADCLVNGEKFIDYVKSTVTNRLQLLGNLQAKLEDLSDVIKVASKSDFDVEDNLNNTYCRVIHDISVIVQNELMYRVAGKYRIPFTNLFLAQREILKDKTSIENVLKVLSAFQGEIRDKISKLKGFLAGKKEVDVESVLMGIRNNKASIQHTTFKKPLQWEDITIRFLNGHNVFLFVKGKQENTDYIGMNMWSRKNKLPNEQWKTFERLVNYNNGVGVDKKQVSSLRKKLKQYFGIDADPLYEYKDRRGYYLKMNLISNIGSGASQDDSDTKSYFAEQQTL